MKKINVTVSDEAHNYLTDHKKKKGFRNIDEALDDILTNTKEDE